MVLEHPFQIISDQEAIIFAKKEFFERACLLTVAEKYTQQYAITIVPSDEATVAMTFYAKHGVPMSEEFLKHVMNELIDQQVRLDLQKEFGSLRDYIVKQAFRAVE